VIVTPCSRIAPTAAFHERSKLAGRPYPAGTGS
jgi:hypothetical protein